MHVKAMTNVYCDGYYVWFEVSDEETYM